MKTPTLLRMELEDATRFSDLPYHIVHRILPYLDSTQQLFQVLVLLKSGTINRRFTSKPLFDYSKQLYDKYHKSFEEYITKKVLPSLIKRDHVSMLRALVRRWSNHGNMVWWLSHFFNYPKHYFKPPRSLPPPAEFGDAYFRDLPRLDEFGVACFRDLVYKEVKGKVRDVVLYLIEQEREGEQIGRAALLKKVINIFVQIGMGNMEYYENDFEAFMLKDTELYYKRKASDWILEYSCLDYLLKAEECLKREKDRIKPLWHYSSSGYLHYSSEPKLLEIVQRELLTNYATKLLENEHSGFHALLRDDKVDDLSRMYRLFSKIPKGLARISSMFKQHVTAEDTTLVKQAEDAASNKKAEKRDVVGLQEQVFVRKVIELYVKYLPYVNDCFMNDTLFHKALKEAFEIFSNECLAGSSSAELLATFCDNILKKGRNEKLSDEAIDTLEKVVKLLAYISDKDVFAEFDRMGSEDLHWGEDELSCIPISERSERMVLRMFSYLDCPLEYFPLRRSKSWFIYKMVPQEPLESLPDLITAVLWYDKWRVAFEMDLKTKVLPYLREMHDEFMLREFVREWSDHKVIVKWFFRAQQSLLGLNELGLECFRDWVYQEVNGKVRDAVISLINQEREGEQIDRALLKNVLDIFVEIGMGQMQYYENDFEASMLKDTSSYYSRKASNWIREYSWIDYMLKVAECLKREKDRVNHYLHFSSEPKLLERVQHELLTVYATRLLRKEHLNRRWSAQTCHRDDKVDDLSMMYMRFSKIPKGLVLLSNMFKQRVTDEGTALVEQAEDAASNKKAKKRDVVGLQEQVFVRKVIELHDKYLAYVTDRFMNHRLFHKALEEGFEIFCNKGVAGSSSAELLATFCDNILKKGGSEKLSNEVIEDMLEKVVKLLAYISDKDLFAEFYRKKFARRLLFDKSANDEHERSILIKLKQQCGFQFTSKMEGMVTDLTLAKEKQSHFEEYLSNNPNVIPGIDIDFTVTVLTSGFWPSHKSFEINLPAEMVKCVEVFREFYQTKTKHRKLTWIYSLGTCNINGKFDAKTIELIVTTYQASVLLLFNSSDRLSYQEIMTQLNLSDDNVVRLLHSLSCAKYKILLKEPNTKPISRTDTFEFNSKFTDRMRRIKIPLPPMDEKKKVIEAVDKDRRYTIEASIVRIMKWREVLGYRQLVKECGEQLVHIFKPDVKAIKQRIEDLITRDYLERDKEDPNLLRYLVR